MEEKNNKPSKQKIICSNCGLDFESLIRIGGAFVCDDCAEDILLLSKRPGVEKIVKRHRVLND